jgi:hypothetical protein
MTAYNPPLFSFSTLKFNSLIYEVADTLTTVASSIVNVLSIITNKIFTYDVNVSRELWTDSTITPIFIGTDTTMIDVGGFRALGGNLTFNPIEPINLFDDSASLALGNNSILVELGHSQAVGDLLYVGNQLNTNYIGGFKLIDQTLTALVNSNPVNLFNPNTASITLGQNVDIGNSITIGNSDCNINIGGFQMSFGNLTYYTSLNPVFLFNDSNVIYFGQNSTELYIGQGQTATDYLYVGNQVNINYVAGFQIVNQSIVALVDPDPVYLVTTTTGQIDFGTGQGATNNLRIGSATNNNKIGNFNFTGDSITSSSATTTVTFMNNLTSGVLTIGSNTNTNKIGGFEIVNQTLTGQVSTDPVNLFDTNTASITLGQGVDIGNSITIGNSLCEVNLGNYIFQANGAVRCTNPSLPLSLYSDSATLTIGDSSNYIYFGQAQILGDAVYIGNQNNTNYIAGIQIDNQTMIAQVPADPVLLFKSNQIIELGTTQVATNTITVGNDTNTNYIGGIQIDNQTLAAINPTTPVNLFNADEIITLGTSQVATNTLTIGSATNDNKIGNFNFVGNAITSSSATTNATFMNNLTSASLSIGTNQTSSANLNLGSSVSTVLCGSNFRFQALALTSGAVSSAITFYNNITTGSLTILGSLTTAFVNIGGTAVTTGGLRLYNAITMGYTTLITPTANQVGYIQVGTGTLNQSTITPTTIRTLVLGVGVWIIKAHVWFNASLNFGAIYISNTNNAIDVNFSTITSGTASGNNAGEANKYLTVTSGTVTQYLVVDSGPAGTRTLQGVSFQALRIA